MPDRYRLRFTPVDRWHFHDGRPFHQDDTGQSVAGVVFPPFPHVLASALRVVLARQLGWSGVGDWTESAAIPALSSLGSGLWDMGALSLDRVRVLWEGSPYAPAPLCLEKGPDETWRWPNAAGNPSRAAAVQSAMGCFARMDQISDPDAPWVAFADEARCVRDQSSELISSLTPRTRVGIALTPETKQARDGMLYAAAFTEPGRDLKLEVDVSATDAALQGALRGLVGQSVLCALGGKGRAAVLDTEPVSTPTQDNLPEANAWLVHLLTPALWDTAAPDPLAGWTIQRRWQDRPIRFGPWDRDTRTRQSWSWALSAGTCWQVTATKDEIAQRLAEGLNRCTSPSPEHARSAGFGELHAIALQE